MTIARATTLAALVLIIASCSKLRAIGGTTTQPTTSATPGLHVLTGPLPTHAGKDQTWHVQPYKCSVDDKVLGNCGNAPSHAARSPSFWFHSESPPVYHRRASPRPRSR